MARVCSRHAGRERPGIRLHSKPPGPAPDETVVTDANRSDSDPSTERARRWSLQRMRSTPCKAASGVRHLCCCVCEVTAADALDPMQSRLDAVVRPTRPRPRALHAQRTRCTSFAPRVWRVRVRVCALVRTGAGARRRLAARTAIRRRPPLQHAPHQWLQALPETAARARGGNASCAEHGLARET